MVATNMFVKSSVVRCKINSFDWKHIKTNENIKKSNNNIDFVIGNMNVQHLARAGNLSKLANIKHVPLLGGMYVL